MDKIQKLQEEINIIQKRNKRVEADKAWETSWVRRIFVACATYAVMSLFMLSVGVERPFVSAIIPTIGYLLSTASLGIFKSWWLKRRLNF